MKFLTFGFLMFVSFSVFANCDAPIELALSVDDNEQGRVILKYVDNGWNNSALSGFVYRAKRLNDEWVEIHKFEIAATEGEDEYFITSEECVPPGEWTYIAPFDCNNTHACWCKNYNKIDVDVYSSDCVNLSQNSDITSEEFQQMQMMEYNYGPESDDYGNDDDSKSDGCSILIF